MVVPKEKMRFGVVVRIWLYSCNYLKLYSESNVNMKVFSSDMNTNVHLTYSHLKNDFIRVFFKDVLFSLRNRFAVIKTIRLHV